MAFLGKILDRIKKKYVVKISGYYIPTHTINGVKLLTGKKIDKINNNILYVGDYQANYMFQGNSNFLLINTNKRRKQHLSNNLYIDMDLQIFDLVNDIEDEILKYQEMKLKRELLFEALYSDNGLNGLLNTAHDYLLNPITLCDTSFSILSSAPKLNDDDDIDSLNGRQFIREDKIRNMKKKNVLEHLQNSSEPLIIYVDDNPRMMVFQSIKIRNSTIAYLFTQAQNRDITLEDIEYIQSLSQMISVELQKENTFRKANSYKYEFFMTELINGHFKQKEYIQRQIKQLGHDYGTSYNIIVCNLPSEKISNLNAQKYCESLKSIVPNSMVIVYKKYIVILLIQNDKHQLTIESLDNFRTFLEFNSLSAMISYSFENIVDANNFYNQVVKLLNLPTTQIEPGQYISYENHYLEHIFSYESDNKKLFTMIHPQIRKIRKYDKQNSTEYIKTLEVFIDSNRNASLAAKKLFIHKSTMFYRLNKMNELFNIDITDSKSLFAFEYSIHLMHYIDKKNNI